MTQKPIPSSAGGFAIHLKCLPFLVLLLGAVITFQCPGLHAADPSRSVPRTWQDTVTSARGQMVYFHAWGGEQRNNDYLQWVADQVQSLYQIELQHVKIRDTASAVSRVLAEKQAGNTLNGAIDLLWINGENFASMRDNNLLYGPWAEQLPNFTLVNAPQYPEMRHDFSVPVEGYEAPWLRAHLVFYYDSAYLSAPPRSMRELLAWAIANPGEFTYPRPPDFLGSTFLKQALIELTRDPDVLQQPVSQSNFDAITAPLWQFLDDLHPKLLRQGRAFPANAPEMRRLLADGETLLAFSFNPNDPVNRVRQGELPESIRSYTMRSGTLANVSFVAIPFNATHKAAAQVVANFLLSPEAQLRAQDPDHLGSSSVLDTSLLNRTQQDAFRALTQKHPSALPESEQGNTLQEPHPDWMPALESAWMRRYGVN